ncbi:MAG: TolC family protein [Verrucomicrobiales bacterium]
MFPNSHNDLLKNGCAVLALWLAYASSLAAAPRGSTQFTLEGALDRVVATDQTIAIADYEVRKARVEQMRTFSRMLPSLSIGADASWRGNRTKETVEIEQPAPATVTPAATGGAGTPAAGGQADAPVMVLPRVVRETRWTRTRSNQQSLGLNFDQPILDFTLGPARRQGELGRQITEWQLRQRVREVLFGVTQQYFEVIKQDRLVEEGRKTLGLTGEQIEQAEARLEAEEVIESDVLLARVDNERARRSVMQSENNLALARARLSVTLNLDPTHPLSLVEPAKGRLAANDLGQAVSVAHSQREDVRVAQLTLTRTHAQRDEIKARYAPTLDFQHSRELSTSSSVERSIGWTAGLSLNWSLFDRGQREFDLKANKLQIGQEGLRVEDTLRVIAGEVIDAWYAVDLLKKTLASLRVELASAEANFKVQQEKYRSGLGTSLDIQTAIRDLAQARGQLVSSTYDLEVAYRDLESVLALFQSARVDQAVQRLVSPGVQSSPATKGLPLLQP